MKKEPLYYGVEIMSWIWLLPIRLTKSNKNKSIRVIGILSTFIYAIPIVIITGIPVSLMLLVLLIIQMCYDA